MFWLEIFLPILMAVIGIAILFSDDRQQRVAAISLIDNGRDQIREFAGRQEDKSQIKERLEELGSNDNASYQDFRYRQALVGAAFGFLPFVLNFLMILNLFQAISFSVFMGIGAYLAYDKHLNSLVKQRRELIEAEFPAIIEMLTLAIAAGEPPISAFSRVSERSTSILAGEFKKVVFQVRNGIPFHEALDQMGADEARSPGHQIPSHARLPGNPLVSGARYPVLTAPGTASRVRPSCPRTDRS